jgi:hydrogenase-4 component F
MVYALICFPILMAVIAFALPSGKDGSKAAWRPWLMPFTSVVFLALTAEALREPARSYAGGWLVLDAPGKLVLVLVSVLYCLCSIYAVGYLRCRPQRSNRIFCACMLAFPGLISIVIWSHQPGLMWVGIESTALIMAPLIYFKHTRGSLEAVWKYMIVGAVGIALALLGTFFLAYSSLKVGLPSALLFEDLVHNAPLLSKPWLHGAFVMLLVGYGTKMGLAPMHTWKPDAYGEAPGVVGALLAGGVTSCAFLALVRVFGVMQAAGEGPYASRLLVFMGLFSMAVAGVFMVGQRDFKRMLAYSSVEHMGILVLGLGLGGLATFGAFLHLLNNALTKGVLFLSAGNIQRAFDSKSTDEVHGAMTRLPWSGTLFLFGFLAVTGSPPFAPFISEFTILNGAFGMGRYVVGGLFLLFLMVVFVGMGATVLGVVQGRPSPESRRTPYRDGLLTCAPIVVAMALVLLLGVYLPKPLAALVQEAASSLDVHP